MLSGIIVPEHMTAILYADGNYQGQSVTIDGPQKVCDIRTKGFPDNEMSSMQVIHHKVPQVKTEGSWVVAEQKVGEGDMTVSLTKSYTTSTSHSLTKTDQETITMSVEGGLIFEKTTVSGSISHQQSETVSTIISSTTSETCSATCLNPTGGPVAMFQWKTNTPDVENTNVLTCYYVCRHGRNVLSDPACPAGACEDAECTKCFDWHKKTEENRPELVEDIPDAKEKAFLN